MPDSQDLPPTPNFPPLQAPTAWQYTDSTNTVVWRYNETGAMESCVATRDDVLTWQAAGNSIQPAGV